MRRTEQEFKAEILRRSEAYCQQRAQKRKKLIGAGICACLCIAVLGVLAPMGGRTSDSAAMEMLSIGAPKNETAMHQDPESAPEFVMDEAAPMENEPAAGDTAAVMVICGDEEITLDADDSATIMGYLASDDWVQSAANCLCDYTLHVNGEVYHYHSDCGTIQNESGQSLMLSDADKQITNGILESYMD